MSGHKAINFSKEVYNFFDISLHLGENILNTEI